MTSINVWQVIYFYIICRYINIKIKELNQTIKDIVENKLLTNRMNVKKTIFSLNQIYLEINDYNNSLWSKFLFTIWLFFGSCIIIVLYSMFFTQMSIINKMIYTYIMILLGMCFIIIITSAFSVNYEANKTYKFMESFMAYGGLRKKYGSNRSRSRKGNTKRVRVVYGLQPKPEPIRVVYFFAVA